MDTQTLQPLEKLKLFIKQLESKERKIISRRIFLLVSLGTFFCTIAWVGFNRLDRNAYIYIQDTEVIDIPLHTLFETRVKGVILIKHGGSPIDTFFTKSEMVQYVEKFNIQGADSWDKVDTQTASNRQTEHQKNKKNLTLPVYPVLIEGKMFVGEEIFFSLHPYDPMVSYTIDFGDGHRSVMMNRIKYTYSQSGTYEVKITAHCKGWKSSVYQEVIKVSNKTHQVERKNNLLYASYGSYEEAWVEKLNNL